MKRPPPIPPHPELVRSPHGSFGWLEDRLLHENWLASIGPDGSAVLLLLALAADRRGASFFSRARIATALAMDVERIDRALTLLVTRGLVALRPWRSGSRDGVWQLLPLPARVEDQRTGAVLPLHQILARLGLADRP